VERGEIIAREYDYQLIECHSENFKGVRSLDYPSVDRGTAKGI
jgi:hypothetical protein